MVASCWDRMYSLHHHPIRRTIVVLPSTPFHPRTRFDKVFILLERFKKGRTASIFPRLVPSSAPRTLFESGLSLSRPHTRPCSGSHLICLHLLCPHSYFLRTSKVCIHVFPDSSMLSSKEAHRRAAVGTQRYLALRVLVSEHRGKDYIIFTLFEDTVSITSQTLTSVSSASIWGVH